MDSPHPSSSFSLSLELSQTIKLDAMKSLPPEQMDCPTFSLSLALSTAIAAVEDKIHKNISLSLALSPAIVVDGHITNYVTKILKRNNPGFKIHNNNEPT